MNLKDVFDESIKKERQVMIDEIRGNLKKLRKIYDALPLLDGIDWPQDADLRISFGTIYLTVPFNPVNNVKLLDQLKEKGWDTGDDYSRFFKREPSATSSCSSIWEPSARFYIWLSIKIFADNEKPASQTCHLVQIGEREELRKVKVYDTVCEEGFRELMKTLIPENA